MDEKPFRWINPSEFMELLKNDPQENELDITFFKDSNYRLMPKVEMIYYFLRHEKPEKILYREIMNVWKNKYSTPAFQEVLELQKFNILLKAKSYKQLQNTETLGQEHIKKSDNDDQNYNACTTNMIQTRSKSKTDGKIILKKNENK